MPILEYACETHNVVFKNFDALENRFKELIIISPLKIIHKHYPYLETEETSVKYDIYILVPIKDDDDGKFFCKDCFLYPCDDQSCLDKPTLNIVTYFAEQAKDGDAGWDLFVSQRLMENMTIESI